MNIREYDIDTFKDKRGFLSVAENYNQLPFLVKRIYYIYGVPPNTRRGYHAHKKLEQVCICISGSCKIMLDDGHDKVVVDLNSPVHALYVGPGIWREMYDFSHDAVLLVLASNTYDESDYIRDYLEFRGVS